MTRHYDWQPIFDRQTGSQGEVACVVGAKGIGKTFGLRLRCMEERQRKGYSFVEICRSEEEAKLISVGYADKLQQEGFFPGLRFKTESKVLYQSREPFDEDDNPEWEPCVYFVALTKFQTEKKRTYSNLRRFIFDEFVIDRKDRYHQYLPSEYLILANLVDTITREQPGGTPFYRLYMLGNACDLTCPHLRAMGVNDVPKYGYHWYNDKHTLLHYVEPWDAEERQRETLAGRMLAGNDEARMVYQNKFVSGYVGDICKKPSNARYTFGLRYKKQVFGVWIDRKNGYFHITGYVPRGSKNVHALTKSDMTVSYKAIEKTAPILKILNNGYYAGLLRYENALVKELFLTVLDYLGVR